MKKLLCLMLALSLIVGSTLTVFAGETIVIEGEGNKDAADAAPTEEKSEEKSEEVKEETPAADSAEETKQEEAPAETKSEEKQEEPKKADLQVVENKTFLALGKNLSQDQLNTVLSLMGISADKLPNYNVIFVTNEDEHAYLDSYIDKSVIGTKALSSVLVRPASSGHGVTVTTHNVTYCTEQMYMNALVTAGVTDAEVIVAAPSPLSGTAALIGALKAYSAMTGTNVSEKALDTALDELVTTGEVSQALGDDEAATELISYIKAQIAANDLETKEEIEAAVRQGDQKFNSNLTEDEIKQIVDVMLKIKAMGIDFDVLAEQAEEIYAKYGDQIKAGTFKLENVDWKDLGIGKVIGNAVGNFFKDLGDSIKGFFSGLFGKND